MKTNFSAEGEGTDEISHAAECSNGFRLPEIQKGEF
jgi:hypothetical protein